MPAPKRRRFRDVVTGLFTSKAKAAASPDTTVAETYGPTLREILLADEVRILSAWHAAEAEKAIATVGGVNLYEFHYKAARSLDQAADAMVAHR